MRRGLLLLLILSVSILHAQSKATNLVVEGNERHQEATYEQAEAAYRKSLSIRDNYATAQHLSLIHI